MNTTVCMRCITFDKFGGPDVLRLAERPIPYAGQAEVVVRVRAAAVNPTDNLMRSGQQAALMSQLAPPYIAGMEFAGHVHAIGQGVEHLSPGQPVMGVVNPRRAAGGAHTQYVCVPAASVVGLDAAVNLAEAATVPMNGLTAQMALANLTAGSNLLVTGAAGVLAAYVIQLAKVAGIRVIADAQEKDIPWLRSLNVDAIVPRGDAMYTAVRERWPSGVDAVVDTALLGTPVGALVRDHGMAISVRRTCPIEDPRLQQFVVSVTEQMHNTQGLQTLASQLQQRILTPRVAQQLPMEQALQAYQLTEQGGFRGRIVLIFSD